MIGLQTYNNSANSPSEISNFAFAVISLLLQKNTEHDFV